MSDPLLPPLKSGDALFVEVDATCTAEGELAFWWLGQQSWIVKAADRVVVLDPFLTDLAGRRVPPMLEPRHLAGASLVLGTHDHADHIDRPVWPAIAAAAPRLRFVVPDLLVDGLVRDLGIGRDRFIGLDDGLSVEHDGVRITAVAAAHEMLDRDPASGRYPYLGYIVELGGVCVYHAGDTCLYPGMVERLWAIRDRVGGFDLALLPINGRDAARLRANLIGNMTYQEAADLAGWIEPRLTVPAHWDMFDANPGDPAAWADYMSVKHPKVATWIARPGERRIVRKG